MTNTATQNGKIPVTIRQSKTSEHYCAFMEGKPVVIGRTFFDCWNNVIKLLRFEQE